MPQDPVAWRGPAGLGCLSWAWWVLDGLPQRSSAGLAGMPGASLRMLHPTGDKFTHTEAKVFPAASNLEQKLQISLNPRLRTHTINLTSAEFYCSKQIPRLAQS